MTNHNAWHVENFLISESILCYVEVSNLSNTQISHVVNNILLE
jgi:hypothetical protein